MMEHDFMICHIKWCHRIRGIRHAMVLMPRQGNSNWVGVAYIGHSRISSGSREGWWLPLRMSMPLEPKPVARGCRCPHRSPRQLVIDQRGHLNTEGAHKRLTGPNVPFTLQFLIHGGKAAPGG